MRDDEQQARKSTDKFSAQPLRCGSNKSRQCSSMVGSLWVRDGRARFRAVRSTLLVVKKDSFHRRSSSYKCQRCVEQPFRLMHYSFFAHIPFYPSV